MPVDRAWVVQNTGFDPLSKPLPASAVSFAGAAKPSSTPEDFQREIIDFDSESPAGKEFFALTKATGLTAFTDIPWPKGLAPKTGPKPKGGSGPLPGADILVVTWTVDEGHALSRVFTPGKDSRNDYVPYTHNFATIAKKMSKGCPAVKAKRLGAFWTTTIGGKKIVVFKSESHLSQDTKKLPPKNGTLPNFDVWLQIIEEVRPKLVLTTGTGGGIGDDFEVGDVVVSPVVHFDSQKWLKPAPFAQEVFKDGPPKTKLFAQAKKLFAANKGQLPQTNKRPPKIFVGKTPPTSVVTTDFFGFDTSNNRYHLQGEGDVSEMGDAVLGLVAQKMGKAAPPWLAVRNVSDPQISASVGDERAQAQIAAHIYKTYGRWSTVCSAIVCWALIAAE